MADIEVSVHGVGTVGHGTAELVGPVPHNLRTNKTQNHPQLESLMS